MQQRRNYILERSPHGHGKTWNIPLRFISNLPRSIAIRTCIFTKRTKIGYIKEIEKGRSISYGRNYQTEKESIIGTLPFGYGDGYTKLLTNKTHVLINGQKAPLVGNICMDQCMVDMTDIKGNIEVGGDEVVVVGKQGNEEIPVEEPFIKMW